MEAVPRLPMIFFHLKTSPEPTVFGSKLKQYIRDFYNEDSESYTNEIHQLESLRAMAVGPSISPTGLALLKKYYCQLHFLQSRFPMGKDGISAVVFTWKDAYANIVCSLANIRFEIISILYNIGAMHTQLGGNTERTMANGMKEACAHFQSAAWAFEHLKRCFTVSQPFGVDLAPELMNFIHQLCLAQAQECILEKSMLDNRKPSIVSKVARQIVDYYAIALNTLEQGGNENGTVSDTVGTKIYKSWKRYVNFKKSYYLAVTYLYQGLTAEEQRKMGERVAFYNVALASLNEAHSIYTGAKGSIGTTEEQTTVEEALTFSNDVIEGKRKAAKNENEFIYHEEIPEKDVLPIIKGASLVKGIPFNINDLETSGPDIFARLVPMKVHEASSLYSEEKAKLLRTIGGKIEDKDHQLNIYLASLRLEYMSLYDPDVQTSDLECFPIPDELIERCAALNGKPNAIQDLLDTMKQLTDTSINVDNVLKEMKKLLSEEESREKQYQEAVGKRPPTIVATDLTREAKKYEEAHNKALESNQTLHKAIAMHVKNLKILSQPLADLIAYIPSPNIIDSNQEKHKKSNREIDKIHAQELKRILNKVDEMRRQRNELHSKLREAIAQDDLTRLLVTATSESGLIDRLFAEQLGKHQTVVNLIEQNLSAQDNVLAALTDAYAKTADIRKNVEEVMKHREYTISFLITSYDAYEDMLTKCNKGLEFYHKLEANVSKLLQRIKSTCKVQEEEREQILAQNDTNVIHQTEIVGSSLGYETDQISNPSGLKLKDYLNNRNESIPGHDNQYYNYTTSTSDTNYTEPTYYHYGTQNNPYTQDQYYNATASYNATYGIPEQQNLNYNQYPSNQDVQPQGQYPNVPQSYNALQYSNTYQNYQPSTSNNYDPVTGIIQSHTKTSYPTPYQYPYSNFLQYQNYPQDYSYPGEAETNAYVHEPTGQNYQYNANTEISPVNNENQKPQDNNVYYTNATNNQSLSQTPSSQYPNTEFLTNSSSNEIYYSTQYGLQMQNQGTSNGIDGSTPKAEIQNNYQQTYMQAVDNGTTTTTSSEPMKLTTKSTTESKSNVDLLADLDITINDAPLVPEVRPLNKIQSKEEDTRSDTIVVERVSTNVEDKILDNLQIVWDTWYTDVQPKKDPLGDPMVLQKFINDVEKYEKFVDSLLIKTLSGATNLDIKWKEVQDFEKRIYATQSSLGALQHASENRDMDCISYDKTRVKLSTTKSSDPYINASNVNEITQWIPTAFIITQAPMKNVIEDFWTMIWEQECEVIACLISSVQLNEEPYWPITEANHLNYSSFKISLKKTIKNTSYVQRIISILHNEDKIERTIVHMEFLLWPSNGIPSSPGALLGFSSDVMTEQALRRCSPKPVVVHCLNGGTLSSLFLVAAATVCHIRAGCGIVDVPLVYKGLVKCRKKVVDEEFLLFAYRMVLYHAQDILMKRGILSSTRSTFENFNSLKGSREKLSKKLHCHPSDDFLHNLGVGMQRPKSEQTGNAQTNSTNNKVDHHSSTQDKMNGRVVDPLSQLDPLWSIRR